MEEAGCAERLHAEGFVHDGVQLSYGEDLVHINIIETAGQAGRGLRPDGGDPRPLRRAGGSGRPDRVRGRGRGGPRHCDSDAPYLTYTVEGRTARRLDLRVHRGLRRLPWRQPTEHPGDRRPPRIREGLSLRLAWHPVRDAARCAGDPVCQFRAGLRAVFDAQRAPQPLLHPVPADRPVEDWSDEAFWDEFKRRIPSEVAANLVTGPSIEKSIAPLRSFVCEPMRWGRLFLCGDAAPISCRRRGPRGSTRPPRTCTTSITGWSKYYQDRLQRPGIDAYSEKALRGCGKRSVSRGGLPALMHRYPDMSEFDERMQVADLAFLRSNRAAQTAMAQNYVGPALLREGAHGQIRHKA
jgi:p-hydroxybenzoate 3-monooxygenase